MKIMNDSYFSINRFTFLWCVYFLRFSLESEWGNDEELINLLQAKDSKNKTVNRRSQKDELRSETLLIRFFEKSKLIKLLQINVRWLNGDRIWRSKIFFTWKKW